MTTTTTTTTEKKNNNTPDKWLDKRAFEKLPTEAKTTVTRFKDLKGRSPSLALHVLAMRDFNPDRYAEMKAASKEKKWDIEPFTIPYFHSSQALGEGFPPCRWFNSPNGWRSCKKGEGCNFKHICIFCGSSKHGAYDIDRISGANFCRYFRNFEEEIQNEISLDPPGSTTRRQILQNLEKMAATLSQEIVPLSL